MKEAEQGNTASLEYMPFLKIIAYFIHSNTKV